MAPLVLAAALALAAPHGGVVVPGKTFGGLALGATAAQVRAAWGDRYGVCRSCKATTWYFNERDFEPQGVAVEFRNGRVSALFTIWQPTAWRTREGLRIGDLEARAAEVYGALQRVTCGSYDALRLRHAAVDTYFYVRAGRIWGFALSRAAVPACR
jgi:hypothetical protein